MRQCIFVIGSGAELVKIAPTLKLAAESRLRHTVWFTGEDRKSIVELISELGLRTRFVMPEKSRSGSVPGIALFWLPLAFYRCFHYVSGVKTWTTKRPLVVLQGDSMSSWLGSVAGRWGGGDVVQLDSGFTSGKWFKPFPQEPMRRLMQRNVRHAFCADEAAAVRMRRYPACVVEVAPPVVDRLLRLTGGEQTAKSPGSLSG